MPNPFTRLLRPIFSSLKIKNLRIPINHGAAKILAPKAYVVSDAEAPDQKTHAVPIVIATLRQGKTNQFP
jgi:hypothetical protein